MKKKKKEGEGNKGEREGRKSKLEEDSEGDLL
jgi:hypothetical protein